MERKVQHDSSENREKAMEKNTGDLLPHLRGGKVLLAGAPRLGDLLFAFPAMEWLFCTDFFHVFSVLCYGYAAPLLSGLSRKVIHIDQGPYGKLTKFFKERSLIARIDRENFDACIVWDGKESVRKLLRSTNVPVILVELNSNGSKTRQHFDSISSAFPLENSIVNPIPRLVVPEDARQWAQARLQPKSIKQPLIAFHVGCQRLFRNPFSYWKIDFKKIDGDAIKVWPIENFLQLGKKIIQEMGGSVLLVGLGHVERKIADVFCNVLGSNCVNAVGWGDAMQTAALLRQADAVVASDGGILHLSAAVGIKGVALWGPTPLELFAPSCEPGQISILQKDVPCRPCSRKTCDKQCLTSISIEEVYLALKQKLP